jgi:alkaline phosphatase D
VIADQKGMDEWGNYPLERQRLFDLITRTEIGSYELLDFTSSGMTHSKKAYAAANNQYRVAGAYDGLNFGILQFNWDAKPSPEILMVAMDKNGEVVFGYTLSLRELK